LFGSNLDQSWEEKTSQSSSHETGIAAEKDTKQPAELKR
jgi:hypothetical protein